MDTYTQTLASLSEALSPEDDRYEEKLRAIAATFRSFGQALTAFLLEQGYSGDPDSAAEKGRFVKEKFQAAHIPPHRDTVRWFSENREIKSEAAYQLCFAFHLDVAGTRDFFRRVVLARAFDCRAISEAVYYYCIKNRLDHPTARAILEKMPPVKPTAPLTEVREILYTGTILEILDGLPSGDALVAYVTAHPEQFGYNNATATRHIQALWQRLACQDGLAWQEGLLLDKAFSWDQMDKEDAYTLVTAEADSTWRILAQILGLDRRQTRELGAGRSVKPLLENNALLPALAEHSFPDRNGVEQILRGQHVSHERVHKTLILLEFYTYWAERTVAHGSALWQAEEADGARCVDKIDRYLLEAGYPELYPGNPYDWIFLWAAKDPWPLLTFRDHMRTLYAQRA